MNQNSNVIGKPFVFQNTARSTFWGCKIFDEYCTSNGITVDFNSITEVELAEILKKFYTKVTKKDGSSYTPSALIGIRAALNRKITYPPFSRPFTILKGETFGSANSVFSATCKKNSLLKATKRPYNKSLSDEDIQKLEKYFKDHLSNPCRLLQYVWLGISHYFGRRDRDEWRKLTVNSFKLKTDENDCEYLTDVTRPHISHLRGDFDKNLLDVKVTEPRAYDDKFIHAFKLYCKKRNPTYSEFFQNPMEPTDSCWYSNVPLSKNSLVGLMGRISTAARLSTSYTSFMLSLKKVRRLFHDEATALESHYVTPRRKEVLLVSKTKDGRTLVRKSALKVVAAQSSKGSTSSTESSPSATHTSRRHK